MNNKIIFYNTIKSSLLDNILIIIKVLNYNISWDK
jgi:hypothetical protein